MAWIGERDWLECVEVCLEKGWQVWELDPEQVMREYARNERGAVQTALDLGAWPPDTSPPPPSAC